MPRTLFITATREDDGKTAVTLGLMAFFQDSFERIAFLKPLGRRRSASDVADEDTRLMADVFKLRHLPELMNPVLIPRGFPAEYTTEEAIHESRSRVKRAYEEVSRDADLVVIEGTGNAAVGSALGLANATLAARFGSPVVLVASGGITDPIEHVLLNRAMFQAEGTDLAGVIFNRVRPDDMDVVETFSRKYLEDRGIAFLGAIPQNKALSSVSVGQVNDELGARVIAGQEFLANRYDRILIGAMSAREAMDRLSGNVLLVVPGDRDDMLLAAIGTNLLGEEEMRYSLAGVVVTGGIMPHATVVSLLQKVGVPTLLLPGHSAEVYSAVSKVVPKIHAADRQRIFRIQTLVRQHVDTARLLQIVKAHVAVAR